MAHPFYSKEQLIEAFIGWGRWRNEWAAFFVGCDTLLRDENITAVVQVRTIEQAVRLWKIAPQLSETLPKLFDGRVRIELSDED